MANGMKTALLLGALSGMLLLIGDLAGGQQGMMVAFVFAALMNLGSYWFSDKIVLRMYRAQEVGPDHPLYQITRRLSQPGRAADAEGLHHSGPIARTLSRPGGTRSTPRWRRPRASCRC